VVQRSAASGDKLFELPIKPLVILGTEEKDHIMRLNYINDRILRVARVIFRGAGIDLKPEIPDILVPKERLDLQFFKDPTATFVRRHADTNRVPVMFVDGLELPTPGVLGGSGGIPGPQGFILSNGATLLPLSLQPAEKLIRAVVHELGHYLGLTHESAGWGVPKELSEDDKIRAMADNIMFYSSTGTKFNDAQRHIVQQQPIVGVAKVPEDRIKKIEIRITTGDKWPRWFDGPGTAMGVVMDLRSQDGRIIEEWSLRGPFEQGRSKGLTVTPTKLRPNEAKTWTITVGETNWTRNWGGDAWSLSRVTIIADGKTLVDEALDIFLGAGYADSITCALVQGR
jgi:hypothetical protein